MEIRTTKPGKGNKYYITKKSGGWSPCIKGKPTDKDCDVLDNCVGYVVGRVNEESNEGKITFFTSMNAENFFANAYKWGMKTGQEPKQGAIMCWSKGKPGVSKDGAGHVAIVEKVNSPTQVFTSESGWNSFAFKNKTRNKGSNGNCGAGSDYHFLGFIYNPHLKETPKVPGVPRDEYKDQVKVLVDNLRIREDAGTNFDIVGYVVKDNFYNYYETKDNGGYTWYRIGDKQWVATNKDKNYLEVLPHKEPEPPTPPEPPKPTPTELKVGDKVKIIGPYASSANSKSAPHTYAVGWTRYITKIHNGANYPYQVGNKGDTSSKGTTGFCKESSLKKL